MRKAFITACTVAIVLTAAPALPAFSQSPLKSLLNGLNRNTRGNRFNDMQTQTFRMEFALRAGQMIFIEAEPGQTLNESRQLCISGLNDNSGGVPSTSTDLSTPQPILKNGIYQSNERIMRRGDEYRLFTQSCGPVSAAPSSTIDSSNEAQFRAVGVDVAMLSADANNYIQQLQREAEVKAARNQAQADQQAKTDRLWLRASARFLANGEMYTFGADEYSPFQTAEECRTATSKMLRTAVLEQMGRATLSGESVMTFTDASGWVWVGCVSVRDKNSGTFAKFIDQRMTSARAKELKLVLTFQEK